MILSIKDLSKVYKIYANPWNRLLEWALLRKKSFHKKFWAVKNISFELNKGEFLGIIGPNGAGKSTLLKMITNVTPPTNGEFTIHGRVLSILELSGGMDQALTGRENVIRSGQLLGFPDGYVKERMEHIKDFSEINEFFEQPLHTYSTGMRTRLAFAMFAFLDCEVLILDEVLAVGDIFFKQKCFARLEELIAKNTSIILVTHSMGVVQRYCSRVILINQGQVAYDGDTATAINMFLMLRGERELPNLEKIVQEESNEEFLFLPAKASTVTDISQQNWPAESVFTMRSFPKIKGQGRAHLLRLAVLNDMGEPSLVFKQGEKIHLFYEYELKEDINTPVTRIEIRDKFNLLLHSKDSVQARISAPANLPKGSVIRWHQSITLQLAPDNYIFNIELLSANNTTAKLTHKNIQLSKLNQAFAIMLTQHNDENSIAPHGGLVDLPSKLEFSLKEDNLLDTSKQGIKLNEQSTS